MKLFQQLLVGCTAMSLIAPIAAQASDSINLEGMNNYVRSTKKKSSSKKFNSNTFINKVNENLVTVEGNIDDQNKFEAGGFSDTTTLDGKVIFTLGSVSTDDTFDPPTYTGNVKGNYTYQMNLNTSFNGDDNLYVRLKSGNHSGYSSSKTVYNTYLSAGAGKKDKFFVDKIWYTMPVGDTNHTVFVGPQVENYYMHGTTPSIYKSVLKAFTLGGNAAAYGASTSPGAGWKYDFDNGFAVSSNFTTQDGEDTGGMLTEQGKTSWATQVGFTQPQYSVSAIVNQKYNGWTDSYFKSTDGSKRPTATGGTKGDSTNIGLRGWWRPLETGTATPSVSVGYDTSKTDAAGNDSTNAYFVGLTWQDMINVDDRIGIAFGQPQKHEDDTIDPFLYEIYYDYKVSDSITVTPTIFGGTSKNSDGLKTDMNGVVLNTQYNF